MITIVDYGVGNIGSLINMCDHLGFETLATNNAKDLQRASKLILPGVGAFDRAMRSLEEQHLVPILTALAMENRIPILGVCLGMQLLGEGSDEGTLRGLGWIPGRCRRIDPLGISNIRVPHIGWSSVESRKESVIFPVEAEENRFYFVHSYHFLCSRPGDAAATFEYGGERCAAVSAGNVHGVQFHPEKSHLYGMRLLRRFIEAS